MNKYVIAVIDDDIFIGNLIEELLTKEGYLVIRAYSGTEAVMLLSNNKPDLVLLDLMLPGINGEEVFVTIQDIPVIVISANIDIDSKVNMLINGASDYITKPFNNSELIARVAVQLRSIGSSVTSSILQKKGIILDTRLLSVSICDREVKLTRTEFAILKCLMINFNQILTKTQIIDYISGDTEDCLESSLKMHISNLRGKLREVSEISFIEAIWGIGFIFKE